MRLAVAESATGGLISNRITNVSGCSLCFKCSLVAYSNDMKTKLLGVKPQTLKKFGAVSEQVCFEMAEGVKTVAETDLGLSDTGIAGPRGATPGKPVGLFYIGLATPDGTAVERHVFRGDRLENKREAADVALWILRDYLASLNTN